MLKVLNIMKLKKLSINVKKVSLEKKLKIVTEGKNGLRASVRSTLLFSRAMGLLPLTGLSDENGRIKFSLKSPYTVIYFTSLMGQVMLSAMCFFWITHSGISLTNITNTIFYLSSLISLLILANIGWNWSRLLHKVEQIESQLPLLSRNVARYCNATMYCVLSLALGEHLTSVFYGITVAKACDPVNVGETYFWQNWPWIFEYVPYTFWKGLIVEVFNIQSTIMWSYNDLLIMVISIYLTEHFIIHAKMLKKAFKEGYFSCEEFRVQYLKIVRLVHLFNGRIGIYVVTSFGSNLYWICIQLFYSLKALQSIEHSVYFTFSFSFIVARTLLVLLLAARISSNSTKPLLMLYEVPTTKYGIEIKRYINQTKNLKVALSGLNFFHVTRTMILTLLGTIITYELVLLQFNK